MLDASDIPPFTHKIDMFFHFLKRKVAFIAKQFALDIQPTFLILSYHD